MKQGRKRNYDSSGRRAAAAATRLRIAASARRLFAQQGYGVTSIEAIAREANVSAPTFYSIYGSKRRLLFALLDAVDAEADVDGLKQALRAAANNPRRQLHLFVSFTRRFYEQTSDLIDVVRGAGSSEADLVDLWKEGEQRRLRGQAPVIEAWAKAGVLREGLSKQHALDALWSLTGPDNYRLLVAERRWDPAQYQKWLTDSLELLLFR
ncbi:MAG TPA: helix-turn-helix domain-containing protein [Candidatus Acidoferrales bacterium]|nr:helix-turn-helix domain-containing protein [Candidatus Acidoferrales bacterium]